jgi:mono/diheme cytochrome c family protein
MKIWHLFLFFTLFSGCVVKSVMPGNAGLEFDIDFRKVDFRHGWTYLVRPIDSKVSVRDQPSIERGRELFLQHCQTCHGSKEQGKGPLAIALNLEPTNLSKIPKDLSRSYLLLQIKEGKGSMPQWRNILTNNQVEDLTRYIVDLRDH